jgi:hypothetical protein
MTQKTGQTMPDSDWVPIPEVDQSVATYWEWHDGWAWAEREYVGMSFRYDGCCGMDYHRWEFKVSDNG